MRINYFSPIITTQSGIAELALQVIPALSRYADVTFWTEQLPSRSPLSQYAELRQFQAHNCDELRQEQTANVYHLGNDANWHTWIWQVYQMVPGIVVLHDLNLHHFFHKITCEADPSGERYVAELQRCYGYGAGLMARRLLLAEIPLNQMAVYSMAEWALSQATGVLVHTRTGLAELLQYNRWPLVYQALAFAPMRQPAQSPPKAPPYRLILFGHMNYNRRIESVLAALATLPQRSLFQLDIYGRLDHQTQIEACIADWGLAQQVTIHGFVSDELLDRALSQTHLAINLRYPTMGEASFSQLRIWQHRLPSLVTQVGWYAEQPEDVVCYVRPEYEIEDIQRHLQTLIQQPDRYQQMGERGYQRLLTLHQPDAYAQALVQLCQQQDLGYQALTTQYYLQRSAAMLADWGEDLPVAQLTNAIHWLTARESV